MFPTSQTSNPPTVETEPQYNYFLKTKIEINEKEICLEMLQNVGIGGLFLVWTWF